MSPTCTCAGVAIHEGCTGVLLAVGVAVEVGVAVWVGVLVGVLVAVGVLVFVAVLVGVAVGATRVTAVLLAMPAVSTARTVTE
jgi:hypothetical protein